MSSTDRPESWHAPCGRMHRQSRRTHTGSNRSRRPSPALMQRRCRWLISLRFRSMMLRKYRDGSHNTRCRRLVQQHETTGTPGDHRYESERDRIDDARSCVRLRSITRTKGTDKKKPPALRLAAFSPRSPRHVTAQHDGCAWTGHPTGDRTAQCPSLNISRTAFGMQAQARNGVKVMTPAASATDVIIWSPQFATARPQDGSVTTSPAPRRAKEIRIFLFR